MNTLFNRGTKLTSVQSKDNSMGGFVVDANGIKHMPGPERAAIRQVAHELLKTLKPDYHKQIEYDSQMFVSNFVTTIGTNSDAVMDKMAGQNVTMLERKLLNKVGRNENCPCGSGVKYKKCHGTLI